MTRCPKCNTDLTMDLTWMNGMKCLECGEELEMLVPTASELLPVEGLERAREVMRKNPSNHEPGDWQKLSKGMLIRKAKIHLHKHSLGWVDEDHLAHALCRLLMAMWKEKNEQK